MEVISSANVSAAQSRGPIHVQGEGAIAEAGLSVAVDDEATVGSNVIASIKQERLAVRCLKEDFWFPGLNGTTAGGDGKFQHRVTVDGKERLAVPPPPGCVAACR